jgi:A/G-specific adenine glycosylase
MTLAETLIAWHARHGRHDLPWQRERTPYRVWVSEIMLQQTQVATVIGYYQRFMRQMPSLAHLAAASIDEVLHLWSGLGYYSRARNLHRAAQILVDEYGGRFPERVEELVKLPGIGRSTAAAIVSLSFNERATILDGNVKRVLARHFAIDGATNDPQVEQQLWQCADGCTPHADVATYTQAIMDFGATLCTRSDPLCMHCPLQMSCVAFSQGRVKQLPTPRKRADRPSRQVVMLLAVDKDGQVLLQRRPPHGIWGGLWSPPEFDSAEAAAQFCRSTFSALPEESLQMDPLLHAFTHFDLTITPLRVRWQRPVSTIEVDGALWYNARDPARVGLPAPIATLISRVES